MVPKLYNENKLTEDTHAKNMLFPGQFIWKSAAITFSVGCTLEKHNVSTVVWRGTPTVAAV